MSATTLVVVEEFPWPVRSGLSTRIAMVVEALADAGPIDLFAFFQHRRETPCHVPSDVPNERIMTWRLPPPDYGWARRLRWLLSPGTPLELVARMPPPGERTRLRRAFSAWARSHYDLVWFERVAAYELLGRPMLGPTVVDLDDLQDRKLRLRLAARDDGEGPRTRGARARRTAATAQTRLDARRWGSRQRSISRDVARVALCSDEEIRISGLANPAWCPNGYPAPLRPAGRSTVGDPPTVLFQGQLDYLPNVDAARTLVRDVAPRVRHHVPDLQVRLVGHAAPRVQALHQPPVVTVVGRVESMASELALTDVVVVALRWGGGTRLKILEALAHRVPVVSTTVGAEGLGLAPGHDVLVADDAAGLAAACVRLLREPALRERLADGGQATFLAHHERAAAQGRVRAVAASVRGQGEGQAQS